MSANVSTHIFCVFTKGKKMDSQRVDKQLLALLQSLPYFSKLGTSLCIRLSDYAAQLCGCRSTRQIVDGRSSDVSEKFELLLNDLFYTRLECIRLLDNPHTYKESVLLLSEQEIELILENAIYEIIVFSNTSIFKEHFFA